MEKLLKQIPILLLLSLVMISCGKIVDYNEEIDNFKTEDNILYY